jgi:hypothetical protein
MKLVVYSSRTRGFDCRIFIVRTVNTHYVMDTLAERRSILMVES